MPTASEPVANPAIIPAIIIVGGDALALSAAHEICLLQDYRVVVLWPADGDFADAVEAIGAVFVAARPESRDGLEAAGVRRASAILALSNDDQLNLHAALRARDANPRIRIVLRQFNRTLAAKIEQNLPDCSVLSLAWHSAATYAAVALDPSCFRGLQFPERDGPLTGFAFRIAEKDDLVGHTVAEAEERLGARIVAIDGNTGIAPDDRIARGARLILYAAMDRLLESTPRQSGPATHRHIAARVRVGVRHSWRRLRRIDTYMATVAAAALTLFAVATWQFRNSFHSDWLTAAYFVLATMTTTGFGDITPDHHNPFDIGTTMLLMMLGTIFTGIFTAFLASRLTHSQWVRMQGLRPIHRRGHIVVCGCGSIGTGVIDLLLEFDKAIVVVEQKPDAALVERARDRGFELLTGDANRDDTLDLCNLAEAHSLVALTNVDTLNLEIALGARARNPSMPIVLRIAEATFAASIARHFELETTFSVAALAGPVFAGLSRQSGARGRIALDGREFSITEIASVKEAAGEMPEGAISLAMDNDGDFSLVRDFANAGPNSCGLMLVPIGSVDQERGALAAVEERAYDARAPAQGALARR